MEKKNNYPEDTQKRKECYPFAINFIRLQEYNLNFFKDINYVILFEYLLMLSDNFLKKHDEEEFYHSMRKICEESGLKRYTAEKILNYFEEKGLITIRSKAGNFNVNYYKVNYDKIIRILPVLIKNFKEQGENGRINTLRYMHLNKYCYD